jgi:diacylglycerol kinase family enzyme
MSETRAWIVFLINTKCQGGGNLLFQSLANGNYSTEWKVSVIDIADCDPHSLNNALGFDQQQIRNFQQERIVVIGGGDGTVNWAIDLVEHVCPIEILRDNDAARKASVKFAFLPMGTVCEVHRATGWKNYELKFDPGELIKELIKSPNVVPLDVWNITIQPQNKDPERFKMVAFASIGVDAKVIQQQQEKRKNDPQGTDSAFKNKFWYFHYGMKNAFSNIFNGDDLSN